MDTIKAGSFVKLTGGQRGRIINTVDFGGFLGYEIKLITGETVTEARYRFDVVEETLTSYSPAVTTATTTSSSSSSTSTGSTSSGANSSIYETRVITNDADGNTPTLVSDAEIHKFLSAQDNHNTARKTLCDLNMLRAFMGKNGIQQQPHLCPPHVLSQILIKYFMDIRKQDNTEYEPGSLRGMLSSFDRYLKRHSYGFSLIQSIEFCQVREVLKAKQMMLKKEGKGNKPRRADHFTDEELDKLYETGQLGNHHPESILRTLWLQNSIYFGLRGVTEHRDMNWGDVTLCQTADGKEYLQYMERSTKTRTGKNPRDTRQVTPKAWSLPQSSLPERCPVAMYKLYRSLRPVKFCGPDQPFYIASNTRFDPKTSSTWYKCQPVGVNKLGSFMKVMAKNAGLTGDDQENEPPNKKRLTNHSARKYLVQKLKDNNVPDTEIVQITGHKNVQSVNTYSHMSENRHQQIGSFLSGQKIVHTSSSQSITATHGSGSHQQGLSRNDPPPPIASLRCPDARSVLGGNIYGGTFNITINNHISKPRRINVIESDSSSQSQ